MPGNQNQGVGAYKSTPSTKEPFYKQKTRDIAVDKEYKMREFGAF